MDEEQVDDETTRIIMRDAHSGTNWASLMDYGPACTCGHPKADICYRHDEREAS